MPTIHEANFESINSNPTRITENGDTRITQDSNIRITDTIVLNKGISGLYAKGTYIPFTSRVFYKLYSVWKQFFFYVKDSNVWKAPQKVYKNVNGFWKRVY